MDIGRFQKLIEDHPDEFELKLHVDDGVTVLVRSKKGDYKENA